MHGLAEKALENTPDLPYGRLENSEWLRNGGTPSRLAQNCSGKHAAMLATCAIKNWPLRGYMAPSHPLQQAIADVVRELAGEEPGTVSTDGCGTPLFAVTLRGMARAFGLIAAAAPGTAEAAVAAAMRTHPEQVAGEGRDVTALMRQVPGLLAKDGFEGLQLVGLQDGRSLAVKIADGGDRARLPVTLHALELMGLDAAALAVLEPEPVLGGGRPVGRLRAVGFTR
jgi:L-asparaginase II